MPINRRDFLKYMGVSAAALAVSGCWQAGKSTQRPNIIFIMADDLGYGDISCHNPESLIATPNIDNLAKQGIKFNDAHSPAAVCTPTRYGVLTGRYAWRTHLKRDVLNGYSPALIEKDRMTVAKLLQGQGYETACIGKWHLGGGWYTPEGEPFKPERRQPLNVDFSRGMVDCPNDHGFDYSFITAACSTVDSPYVFIENGQCSELPTATMERTDSPITFGSREGPMVPGWKNEDVDPTYVVKSKEFISQHLENNGAQPFFLYLALSAPHAPWLPPDFVKGLTMEGPRGDLVALVDWCVGQISDYLDEQGIADDTLLIFTSDNGPRVGAKGHKSSGPYRGYKSHIWEGGHREPFIARWPGKIQPGSTSDEPIELTDLYATCAALTGAGIGVHAGPDSYNILPALLGKNSGEPIRDALLHHSVYGVFSVRKGDWKLIHETKTSGGWVDPAGEPPVPGSPGQLYNIKNDPYEQHDLWDEHPEIVSELTALLKKYQDQGYSRPGGAA